MSDPNRHVESTTPYSLLSSNDVYLFNEGTNDRLYERLGSHPLTVNGKEGTYFAVWAPDATRVSVIGEFNSWKPDIHPLFSHEVSGIWEGFIPGVVVGDIYKYHVVSRFHGYQVNKADPMARYYEKPPSTASRVWRHTYTWNDHEWMKTRGQRNSLNAPIAVYELHLGSWRRQYDEGWRWLNYREIGPMLCQYIKDLGFTHVELMPVMEHPFTGSWGYQITGFFASTSRYGAPEDLMYMIDLLHQNGIGVILDWVPAHFPSDEHGLGYFDGTHLYEHADRRKGFHPDWQSCIFNYGRNEVRSFLRSSAVFWLDLFHADGLRVDGVASMLYLNYSRNDGDWIPNQYGGRENLEAISLIRQINETVYRLFPDIQVYAEESTDWAMVSRPTYAGGLGFGIKWDMGWMHDTLKYMTKDAIHRRYHHNEMTFRALYAFTENFILPLSHDEVSHGKGSLVGKMPGDDWQKFANLRLLFGWMYGQPGKKLLFMGGEVAQWREWDCNGSIDWYLLDYDRHIGIHRLVKDLNHSYAQEPSLHLNDVHPEGFEWIDCNDADASVFTFIRKGRASDRIILAIYNMTPVPRLNYKIGLPRDGVWRELINTDAKEYGGSGIGNAGAITAINRGHHGRPFSAIVTLPPLAAVFFRSDG
jgi:1,4-alpha-glucan branching enzyme